MVTHPDVSTWRLRNRRAMSRENLVRPPGAGHTVAGGTPGQSSTATDGATERPLPSRALAEFAGTALLVFLGVSSLLVVTAIAGPVQTLGPGGRLLLSVLLGLAFGYAVTLVINSRLGRVSGQYNPSISVMLWLWGRQSARTLLVFLLAQFSGGIVGAHLLLVWGRRAAELQYGATTPLAQAPLWLPAVSEIVSTMVIGLAVIAIMEGRVTGRWAFHLVPLLFGVLAPVAAPLSGLSINAARTLGPGLVAGRYDHLWLYFVAPPLGAVLALLLKRVSQRVRSRSGSPGPRRTRSGPARHDVTTATRALPPPHPRREGRRRHPNRVCGRPCSSTNGGPRPPVT